MEYEHDHGMTYEVVDIPAEMLEEATEYRGKLKQFLNMMIN